jgi:hypothetical protein
MINRAVVVCAVTGVAALVASMRVDVKAQHVYQVAQLPTIPLGEFHNALVPYSTNEIRDDHGIRLGSFGSDLFNDPADSLNEFWSLTDRGPNGLPGRRTFLAPEFNPVILRSRVHGNIVLHQALPIVDQSGRPVTGLANVAGFDEVPWNFNGTVQLADNPNGLDTEGLVRAPDGEFWVAEEYSPSLVHIDRDGRVLNRYVPEGSLLASDEATTPSYPVRKELPRILNARRQNRGFEGLTLTPEARTMFVAMQSPLDYPTTAIGRASRNVRILKWDTRSQRVTGEYVYHFDEVCAFLRQPAGCSVVPGEMKISGLDAINETSFLVLERTDTAAKIYRVDISAATNILGGSWDAVAASPTAATPSLEGLANPASAGIAVLPKTLVVDLSTLPGIPNKIEGIALVRPNVLAIVNDNDFGLVDNATFGADGRLANDTGVTSRLLYVELAAPVE